MTAWSLVVAGPAERPLARLTEGAAAAVVEFMAGPLSETPTVVGKPLQRELAGYWSERRGSYRVTCRLDEDNRQVVVVRIEHWSDVLRKR